MAQDDPFGGELDEAGRALEDFANGPARVAAEQVEAAFAKVGRAIRGEVTSLVKTGEADLDRLARKLVETLAQLAVKSVFGEVSPVNVVMNVPQGAQASDILSSANQIAGAAARAVRRGVRFT